MDNQRPGGPAGDQGPMKSKARVLTASPRHALLVAATSASVLAYEILIMRLFSIGQWHHFAYMAISMALLGFGAAGSLLFLFFGRIQKDLEDWLVGLAGATAVSFSVAFSLSQRVDLDPLLLVWQPSQWLALLLTYLIMALPFILAGGIVGSILSGAGEQAHRMYAADLMGAGCGALAVVPALFLAPPWRLLPALGYLILLGALSCCMRLRRPKRGGMVLLVSGALLALLQLGMPPVPKIHHTKALPMTLSFPDARIEAEKVGPLGLIQVVGSSLIRLVPGLSLNFGLAGDTQGATLPKQKAIFVDADAPSPINRFSGDLDELEYLDFTTMALPYHIRRPETVLVIGAGGGTDVLMALRHHVPEIVALEANGQVAELLLGPFARFSGHVFTRPGVKLEVREARQYLREKEGPYGLIQLSLLDTFVSSAGGLHSVTESYLYTTEAFVLYLSRLSDQGLLSITRWLKLPPRDSLRIFSTALASLRRMELSARPQRHILFIRSWKTSTIVVSKTPFTPEEIARATKFCDERSFDLAYYAGMEKERANRYDVQASAPYFMGANALAGPDPQSFLKDYVFDVSPTTDDRPFFSHFFRWDKAPTLIRQLQREWLPMVDMGYLFILATLGQSLVAGGVLILFPLFFLRWVHRGSPAQRPPPRATDALLTLSYFGLIGLAFMFLEMALLPKYTLLLSHPVYAVAVVLSTLLLFAGCGSLSVRRFQRIGPWFLWIPLGGIFLWIGLQALAGDLLFGRTMGWPLGARMAVAVFSLTPLAFFLGWPFPSGLRVMAERFPGLVPWAWGVNACASVIGAVLGKCLAVGIGFRLLTFSASLLYLLAVAIFHLCFRGKGS